MQGHRCSKKSACQSRPQRRSRRQCERWKKQPRRQGLHHRARNRGRVPVCRTELHIRKRDRRHIRRGRGATGWNWFERPGHEGFKAIGKLGEWANVGRRVGVCSGLFGFAGKGAPTCGLFVWAEACATELSISYERYFCSSACCSRILSRCRKLSKGRLSIQLCTYADRVHYDGFTPYEFRSVYVVSRAGTVYFNPCCNFLSCGLWLRSAPPSFSAYLFIPMAPLPPSWLLSNTQKDGRFVQLGDNGKLLEQGTQVEVAVVPKPSKSAASRQVMALCRNLIVAFTPDID